MTTTTEGSSAKASLKAATKKSAKTKQRKTLRAKLPRSLGVHSDNGRPASLEEARQELLRLVCAQSMPITRALVKEALEGKYLCAKFLFEAVGLCAMKGEELEEVAERESLAGLLLKQWQLPGQVRVESLTAVEVTEVLQSDAGVLLSAEEAPVKS